MFNDGAANRVFRDANAVVSERVVQITWTESENTVQHSIIYPLHRIEEIITVITDE
jgi:hypothetical protein